MDNLAYLGKKGTELYQEQTGLKLEHMRDSRYDVVIHMVTAANGAAKYYTLANNEVRKEGIEDAIEIDNKIKRIWNGHPNLMYR